MHKMAFISVGAILILLGLIALSGTDEGAWLLILPAIPLAMLTNSLDPSARQGLLWDSAHSPPFLNTLGLALVYFLPGLLLLAAGVLRRVSARGVRSASYPRVMKNQRYLLSLALFALCLSACGRPGGDAVPLTSGRVPPVLLFNGTGTSPNDVVAIETLLDKNRITYSTANSSQVDAMSAARLRDYHLIIVPGGDFERIGNGLRKETAAKLRDAVQHGVSYLGICAGAFFAGRSPYNGLNLTSGVQFGFYAVEGRGVRKAAVPVSGAGTPTLEQYWEDGPELTGWGAVVGRYPDGTPAVVQGQFGDGWIILTGIHAEAPESWRGGMEFRTPASADNEYAVTLIRAALERRPLPHF